MEQSLSCRVSSAYGKVMGARYNPWVLVPCWFEGVDTATSSRGHMCGMVESTDPSQLSAAGEPDLRKALLKTTLILPTILPSPTPCKGDSHPQTNKIV